jgi:carbonic anhydrase/acetyltransferase-like protein (isoleucine patch superfamily)
MPIYALGDLEPDIHPEAYVHPDAVLIGDVRIGAFSSVWPGAVLRGDSSYIRIGERTSIQDGTVVHCTEVDPTVVGDRCTIGHMVHLEGCTIGDGCLIGTGSIVLNGAVVGPSSLVGAQAVVGNKKVVPPGARALGVPAQITEGVIEPGSLDWNAEIYVDRGRQYRHELRRLS